VGLRDGLNILRESFSPTGIKMLDCPACSLLTVPTLLSQLLCSHVL